MNTTHGEWTQCKNCTHFEDCTTKEDRDGCYLGETDDKETTMNTPETINIEKYAEALNNLVGMDIGYLGDSDENVNAIVEVINAAIALEKKVRELTEENEMFLRVYTLQSVKIADSKIKTTQRIREMAEERACAFSDGTHMDHYVHMDDLNEIIQEVIKE